MGYIVRDGLRPHIDPELRHWLRWASESGNTPMFVRTVVEAALIACSPDYARLRPVLLELERRYLKGLSGLLHQRSAG